MLEAILAPVVFVALLIAVARYWGLFAEDQHKRVEDSKQGRDP